MKLMAKYLKPFALLLVLCLVFLFGQALCDLNLPNLMSNMVNVGIQQSGIEETSPTSLSENGMELMRRSCIRTLVTGLPKTKRMKNIFTMGTHGPTTHKKL